MEGKVLLLSQLRISDLVAFCLSYEFEDNVATLTDADRFDVQDHAALEFSRRIYKWTRLASRSTKLANMLAPFSPDFGWDRDYELFSPSSATRFSSTPSPRFPIGVNGVTEPPASSLESGRTISRNT